MNYNVSDLDRENCLNCKQSFSLPAGETFDDGSITDYDRLVCVEDAENPYIVNADFGCENYN